MLADGSKSMKTPRVRSGSILFRASGDLIRADRDAVAINRWLGPSFPIKRIRALARALARADRSGLTRLTWMRLPRGMRLRVRLTIAELDRVLAALEVRPPAVDPRLAGLPERAAAVARLAARGLSHREISARLGIATVTVKWHLRSVYRKLGVGRKVELVARGRTS
jgi:LuxR family maltose regulon positive regulatory protein